MTYSKDFIKKVLAYKDKHRLTFEQTSKHFEISIRSLFRWEKKLEPAITRNKPATKVDMKQLMIDVDQYPDAYQWERAQRLGVSKSCIHYALKRLEISFKKNAKTSKGV
jgi:hypothetical protein